MFQQSTNSDFRLNRIDQFANLVFSNVGLVFGYVIMWGVGNILKDLIVNFTDYFEMLF